MKINPTKKEELSDQKQYAKELLHKAIKKFRRRKVVVYSIDDVYSIDLADVSNMSHDNAGVKFLLVVVDCYSHFAWVIPLKNKNKSTVLDAFKSLKTMPRKLWGDQGGEWVNKEFEAFCAQHNVGLYHTFGESKSSIAERFIRTIRNLIMKYLLENNTSKYIKHLPEIVDNYNTTVHSSILDTPKNVYENKVEIVTEPIVNMLNVPTKFKVDDPVRISKVKNTFEKDHTTRWSKEVFLIDEVDDHTFPPVYKIKDQHDEKIAGSFYEQELQLSKLRDYGRIENIIKRKTVDGVKMVYVKYDGYDSKFNAWIPANSLL